VDRFVGGAIEAPSENFLGAVVLEHVFGDPLRPCRQRDKRKSADHEQSAIGVSLVTRAVICQHGILRWEKSPGDGWVKNEEKNTRPNKDLDFPEAGGKCQENLRRTLVRVVEFLIVSA
jgi:hypothetical protein